MTSPAVRLDHGRQAPVRQVVLDVTPLQTTYRSRGVGAYVRGLLTGLSRIGEEVPTWGFSAPIAPGGPLPALTMPALGTRPAMAWWQIAAWGGPPLEGVLPHLTNPLASGLRTSEPYVATVYDLIPAMYPELYLTSRARRWAYRRYLAHLRGAAHLLAISETVMRDAAALLDRSPRDITATPLGVPTLPDPGPLPVSPRPFLLAVATAQPHKNLGFLIEVLGTLPGEARRTPLVVCADRSDRRWVPLLASARARGVRLHLAGRVTPRDLARLYACASAVLVPSLYEGFGLPALEALSMGARVVVSDRGALPEVVGHAGEVLPLDAEAWRTRILQALDGEWALDRQEAIDRSGRFTWEQTARLTLDAYARLH